MPRTTTDQGGRGPLTLTLALLLVLASGPLRAEEVDCSQLMSQPDLDDCAYRLYDQADRLLNEAWAEAVAQARETDARTGDRNEAMLRDAERAWIDYRDRHCESVAWIWGDGNAQPMIQAGCLQSLTERRAEELRDYARDQGPPP